MLLKREEDFLFDEKASKADSSVGNSKKKKKKRKKLVFFFIHSLALLREKAATMTREQRLSFSLLK
jgi:hypothetical protein